MKSRTPVSARSSVTRQYALCTSKPHEVGTCAYSRVDSRERVQTGVWASGIRRSSDARYVVSRVFFSLSLRHLTRLVAVSERRTETRDLGCSRFAKKRANRTPAGRGGVCESALELARGVLGLQRPEPTQGEWVQETSGRDADESMDRERFTTPSIVQIGLETTERGTVQGARSILNTDVTAHQSLENRTELDQLRPSVAASNVTSQYGVACAKTHLARLETPRRRLYRVYPRTRDLIFSVLRLFFFLLFLFSSIRRGTRDGGVDEFQSLVHFEREGLVRREERET